MAKKIMDMITMTRRKDKHYHECCPNCQTIGRTCDECDRPECNPANLRPFEHPLLPGGEFGPGG
jgi:hypothetical protein